MSIFQAAGSTDKHPCSRCENVVILTDRLSRLIRSLAIASGPNTD